MHTSLILGTAFALMATTALAATPAAVTFNLDPAAKQVEATRAPAGLVLAADDDEDEERGLLFRLGLKNDDSVSADSSSDDDAEDEDEDGDDEGSDDDNDGGDNDGSDGSDNDGGDDA